jgi:hypothetical protein
VSYRLQVQTLFQLHVDPAFRVAFRKDAAAATPGLTEIERDELRKLPVTRGREESDDAPHAASEEGSTAFMRIGIQERCRIALPRTYALLEQIAATSGYTLEIDFLQHLDLWRAIPVEYHRDGIEPNPAIHWTETARVLQMANRVFWQFYNYALEVARRDVETTPYLAELARFEYDTLARRILLYKRFVAPGPAKIEAVPESRLVLSTYAELAGYEYTVGSATPAPARAGVVFLYNGERLRALQVDPESRTALEHLDGCVRLGAFAGRTRSVLEGLASLGALTVAS